MCLEGVRVWDGERLLGPATVAWDGDRIQGVDPAAADGHPGLSLVPGLVDTHVHMVAYAGRDKVDDRSWGLVTPWPEQLLHGAAQAQVAMRLGVTTVRDLGAFEPPVGLRRLFDSGAMQGPRVVAFGHVGITAGHGDLIWPPGVRERPPTADGPDECRRLVRTYARMGADGIKVFTSGGVMSTGDRSEWRNHTAAELAAIVDEAHALAMPVAAHAHTEAGIQAALDAGVDSLEHATLITEAQARQAAGQGVTIAPTLVTLERIVQGRTSAPAESVAKGRALYEARGDRLRRAAEAGVTFVLGTDGGSAGIPFGSQFEELRLMAALLALPPETVLRGATSRAAQAVGLGGRVGRIAAGFGADFLVVRGEPWRSLEDFTPDRVVAVVCRGHVVAGRLP